MYFSVYRFFFFSSVVSFVRWPFLARHPASWLCVRTAPPVLRKRRLRFVSVFQALRVRAARSLSVSTLSTEILTFSSKTSRTGLKPTSRCRWGYKLAYRVLHRTVGYRHDRNQILAVAHTHTHTQIGVSLRVCFRCQQQKKTVSCSITETMSPSLWSSIRVMSGSHMIPGTNLPPLSTGKHTHTHTHLLETLPLLSTGVRSNTK